MNRKFILLGLAAVMASFLLLPNPASAIWTEEPANHHSAFACYDKQLVWDTELALWYDTYVPDNAIQSFLFQPSFSGGFINDLATPGAERVIATSSDWNLPAHFLYDPVPRGTRYNRFWDDAVSSSVAGNDTFLEAYNYATTNCPFSSYDLPQYYSENATLDGMDLGSATGDKYAILFTGIAATPASLTMELAELDFIRNTLIGDYGYDPNNITVLFDDGTGAAYINNAATKTNLYNAVSGVGTGMDPTDSLFLWVSGTDGVDRCTTAVRPPEVFGRKILNFNLVDVNFNTGGTFAEDVNLLAFTESCDGQRDNQIVNDNIFVWHKGDVNFVVNNWHIAQAHSQCAVCQSDAVAMQTTRYEVNENGWVIHEIAGVFANAVTNGDIPGDCIAHAELHKTITATEWVSGNIFWLNLQLDMGGKLVAPGNPNGQAFLQWFGGLNVVGLENLWELEIAIEDDLLVVDFVSDSILGLNDVAIETLIFNAFAQDDNLWWQTEVIDIGTLQIPINQANWQLRTDLIAHAESPCKDVPEPSTLCLLVIGALCGFPVLWRRRRR